MTTTRVFSRRSPMPGVHRPSPLAHRTPFIGRRSGVTLIEILVVVGIIGILVAVIGLVGHTVKEKGKRELTRRTMDAVVAAIDQFQAASKPWAVPGTHVTPAGWPKPPNSPLHTDVDKPSLNKPREEPYEPSNNPLNPATQPDYYLGLAQALVDLTKPPVTPSSVWAPAGDGVIRSDEGLYVLLAEVPEAKAMLEKLPESVKERRVELTDVARPVGTSLREVSPMQILDAWRNPLRYRYYTYRNNNRPFLWSAGPDGKFAADPNRTENDPNGRDDIFSDRKD